jgi:hypothetical protein
MVKTLNRVRVMVFNPIFNAIADDAQRDLNEALPALVSRQYTKSAFLSKFVTKSRLSIFFKSNSASLFTGGSFD